MDPRSFEFNDFRLDLQRMALLRDGEEIPLEPKAFDVLRALVERAGRVVPQQELLDVAWPGTFVTPNTLARVVAQLRKAMDDDAREPHIIETVPRRGYRFIPPVTVLDVPASIATPPPIAVSPQPKRRDRRLLVLVAVLGVVGLAAFLATQFWPRPTSKSSSPQPQARQVTTDRGFSGMPAISPDGRLVAYSSDRTGSLEIYVSSLLPGSRQSPITADGGKNVDAAWSRDGQWLAFQSRKRKGIWIVPANGGTPRQVIGYGGQPSWSPDGEQITFSSGTAAQSVLWVVRRDGTGAHPVTKVGSPRGGHVDPDWSHDGRFIAFDASDGGTRRALFVLALDTGRIQRLTSALNAVSPRFSFDDRAIYWGGTTEERNSRIWRIGVDAKTKAGIGEPESVAALDASAIGRLSIARDGTTAIGLIEHDSNLWSVGPPDGDLLREPVRLTNENERVTHPDYSRDGRVAYLQAGIGRPVSTWVMNEDGSGREVLLADTDNVNPRWDDVGKRILVQSKGDGEATFAWIDLATRRATPALTARAGSAFALSPDQRTLAYHLVAPDSVTNVWTIPLSGGAPVQVTRYAGGASYPAWSPDSRWLAVELQKGDDTHVGVVASTGGAIEQLTSARGQSFVHSWSPDGDRIAFAGERDGIWNVFDVSRSTRKVRAWTHFTSSSGYVRFPAWSPRGDRIVFERSIAEGSVWTMTLR